DRLIPADGPVEHHPLLRIRGGAAHRAAAEADQLGGDEDALGVHAVQDVLEALAFLADAVRRGHRQAVEEPLVRVDGMPADLLDLAHFDVTRSKSVWNNVEPGAGRRRKQDFFATRPGGA